MTIKARDLDDDLLREAVHTVKESVRLALAFNGESCPQGTNIHDKDYSGPIVAINLRPLFLQEVAKELSLRFSIMRSEIGSPPAPLAMAESRPAVLAEGVELTKEILGMLPEFKVTYTPQ